MELPGGSPNGVEEMFPAIESLMVKVASTIPGDAPGPTVAFDEGTVPKRFPCPNEFCEHGGLKLVELVQSMVEAEETSRQFDVACEGASGSQKCLQRFVGSIVVTYRRPMTHSAATAHFLPP